MQVGHAKDGCSLVTCALRVHVQRLYRQAAVAAFELHSLHSLLHICWPL